MTQQLRACPSVERVLHMRDSDEASLQQHADDVEPVLCPWLAESIDPHGRSVRQVPALPDSHGCDRSTEAGRLARLDLGKDDGSTAPEDEIDVPMPHAKAPSHDLPPVALHPTRRNRFAELAQAGGCRARHDRTVAHSRQSIVMGTCRP